MQSASNEWFDEAYYQRFYFDKADSNPKCNTRGFNE